MAPNSASSRLSWSDPVPAADLSRSVTLALNSIVELVDKDPEVTPTLVMAGTVLSIIIVLNSVPLLFPKLSITTALICHLPSSNNEVFR